MFYWKRWKSFDIDKIIKTIIITPVVCLLFRGIDSLSDNTLRTNFNNKQACVIIIIIIISILIHYLFYKIIDGILIPIYNYLLNYEYKTKSINCSKS